MLRALYHFSMRMRRAANALGMWGGPLMVLAFAVGWSYSKKYWLIYVGPGDWRATVANGSIGINYEPGLISMTEQATGVPVPRGLRTLPVPGNIVQANTAWWFGGTWEPAKKSLLVPLWFLIAMATAVTAIAWRVDFMASRRARIGCCPKCNYNRAGIPAAAPCPECGATAS